MSWWPFRSLAAETLQSALSELADLRAAHGQLVERVEQLADENADVLEKLRSWSAREAARRRHEASRNLDQLTEGVEQPEPGQLPAEGQPEAISTIIAKQAAARAAAKAAVMRRLRGVG